MSMRSKKWKLTLNADCSSFTADNCTGKISQTIGRFKDGKCTLTLEEGLFLLEGDRAELENVEDTSKYVISFLTSNTSSSLIHHRLLRHLGYIFTTDDSNCEHVHAPDQHFSKSRPSPSIGKLIRVSADDIVWNLVTGAKVDTFVVSVNDSDRPLYLTAEFINDMSPKSVDQILERRASNFACNEEEAI